MIMEKKIYNIIKVTADPNSVRKRFGIQDLVISVEDMLDSLANGKKGEERAEK